MEDLGGVIWIVIVVLGILGKLLDKKGPKQPPVARTGRPGQPPPQKQPAQKPKPPQPANRQGRSAVKGSALQTGRLVNGPDDDEGISLENVQPTLHVWREHKPEPEEAPQPVAQAISVQQAVVWAEILGKPAALRGPRR